jgi:hypothetical protein
VTGDTWSEVFARIESSGARFDNLRTARAFAIDILRAIPGPLPTVLLDAQRVAENLQAGTASPEDQDRIRASCWDLEAVTRVLGVPVHKDPRCCAIRIAIGATERQLGPEPFFWLDNMALFAEGAGLSSLEVGYLLEKHYANAT